MIAPGAHGIACREWRIHGSAEDTKLSTNKQHTLSSDIDVVFEELQRLQCVADIAEVTIDVGLGVAICLLFFAS